jgi:hypothetical protein
MGFINNLLSKFKHSVSEHFKNLAFELSKTDAQRIGERGEMRVFKIMKDSHITSYNYQFHNLYLYKKDGTTAEIDAVILCGKGIIAIEVKNYKGNIYGNDKKTYWDVYYYGSNKKHQLYNPIMQNRAHIGVIRHNVGEDINIPYFSVVIFNDNCKLKITNNTDTYIGHMNEIGKIIQSIINEGADDCLADGQVDDIAKLIIEKQAKPDRDTKKEHIKNVKSKIS